MTPLILFYNLSNEKGKKIRLICLKLHIRIKQVDPQIQNGKHLRMRCLS